MQNSFVSHLILAKCCIASYIDKNSFVNMGFNEVYQICSEKTSCVAYLAIKHDTKEAVLVFRGMGDWSDVWINFRFWQAIWDNEYSVHRGFVKRYNSLKRKVDNLINFVCKSYKLYVTGHSLGGALTALYAINHQGKFDSVMFGSPKIGDKRFCKLLDDINITHYINQGDFITRIPSIGYRRGGHEIILPNNLDRTSFVKRLTDPLHPHRVRTYYNRLYASSLK